MGRCGDSSGPVAGASALTRVTGEDRRAGAQGKLRPVHSARGHVPITGSLLVSDPEAAAASAAATANATTAIAAT